jgi:hypothetical protein
LPIGLYFSDLIKPREIIPSGTCYQRLLDRVPDSGTINLDSRRFLGFSSSLFNVWWEKWCDHLFCVSPKIYCQQLDPDYVASADEVLLLSVYLMHCLTILIFVISSFFSFPFQPETIEPPAVSKSGKSIQYWPPRPVPYIGHKAPSISSIMQGPRTNPVSDNLPLSTLKRKGVPRKTLSQKTRKIIDTTDVDLPDLAGKLASAFDVLNSSLTFCFSPFAFLTKLF